MANYEYDGHGRRATQWRSDGTVRVSLYTLDGRLQGREERGQVHLKQFNLETPTSDRP